MKLNACTLLLLAGCLPDLSDTLKGGKDGGETLVVDTASGGAALVVDATSEDAWAYLDLDTAALTDDGDAGWDLGFRRFEVKLNGGISGDGGCEATAVPAADFDGLTEVPGDAEWATDAADADGDEVPEYALLDWYVYDYDTHLLSPAEVVWVVRSTDDALYKVAFDSYYDGNGTPARISLRFAPL